MKVFVTFLFFVLIFTTTADCAITHKFGPYYGKVIEADTKEPIKGAAVLVVFYTLDHGPAGAISHYADALETVTDMHGEFHIPSHRITLFRPLQSWDINGYFTIFKPGYGCYPHHKNVKPMFVPNATLPEANKVIIELPKLNSRQERIESTHCSPPSYLPYLKAKNFIDLINKENKALGLGEEKYK